MSRIRQQGWATRTFLGFLGTTLIGMSPPRTNAQDPAPGAAPVPSSSEVCGVEVLAPEPSPPPPAESDKPLPINLPTALRLANVAPVEIALAAQRIRVAVAVLERAKV